MIQTPLGTIEMTKDGKSVDCTIRRVRNDNLCPELNGRFAVLIDYIPDGQEHTVMAYVMTELCKEPSIPSFDYYNGILEGYRQNGLPTQPLKQAWEHCVEEVPRETERINRSACGQLSPRRKKDRGR